MAARRPRVLSSADQAGEPAGAAEAADDEELLASPRRNLVWAVMAILAIVGSMLGRC